MVGSATSRPGDGPLDVVRVALVHARRGAVDVGPVDREVGDELRSAPGGGVEGEVAGAPVHLRDPVELAGEAVDLARHAHAPCTCFFFSQTSSLEVAAGCADEPLVDLGRAPGSRRSRRSTPVTEVGEPVAGGAVHRPRRRGCAPCRPGSSPPPRRAAGGAARSDRSRPPRATARDSASLTAGQLASSSVSPASRSGPGRGSSAPAVGGSRRVGSNSPSGWSMRRPVHHALAPGAGRCSACASSKTSGSSTRIAARPLMSKKRR